jgi:hypothetical protein
MISAMNFNFWNCLESIRGCEAVSAVWRENLGSHYASFSAAFLRFQSEAVRFYPCPRNCGCAHEVIQHSDGSLVGVCRCESWNCEDLCLTATDIASFQLSWPHLGQAICKALGLKPKSAENALPGTRQIGAWSADAVPVILTVQSQAVDFRRVVAELVARLGRRFILLAPTPAHFDVASQELLVRAEAAFFALDAHLTLMSGGSLQSAKAPGELFAQLQPEAKEGSGEDIARSAFALLQQLDSEGPAKPPAVLTVFRLYCLENLTAAQVARKCRCSKTTVVDRLNLIRAKTGMPPERLRAYSSHLTRVLEDVSDSRARRIRSRNLIYDQEEVQEE